MRDAHAVRALIDAVDGGELPEELFTPILLEHLMECCPGCRARLEPVIGDRSEPFHRFADPGESVDDTPAEGWVEELRCASEGERRQVVDGAVGRFRGRPFLRALLREARSHFPDAPREAHAWAELASRVYRLEGEVHAGCEVLALAYRANVHRIYSDYLEAVRGFAAARSLLVEQGVGEVEVSAELDRLEAGLHIDQRRFDRAEELLHRAWLLYRIADDTLARVRTLLVLAHLDVQRQDPDAALAIYRRILMLRDVPQLAPRLYLYTRLGLADIHIRRGEYRDAREDLVLDEPLLERHATPWLVLHVRWREGRIAAGLGELEEAERAFLAVRDDWAELGYGFEAAEACLDLAMVYQQQGRVEELARVTAEAAEIFSNLSAHREAGAALGLLAESARAQTGYAAD